jgi:hypothetical protein
MSTQHLPGSFKAMAVVVAVALVATVLTPLLMTAARVLA